MSFFNSLQQYVTSGVAGLGLSPRRFSLSRQESTEPAAAAGATADKKETNHAQAHHGKYLPIIIPCIPEYSSILSWFYSPEISSKLFIVYIGKYIMWMKNYARNYMFTTHTSKHIHRYNIILIL